MLMNLTPMQLYCQNEILKRAHPWLSLEEEEAKKKELKQWCLVTPLWKNNMLIMSHNHWLYCWWWYWEEDYSEDFFFCFPMRLIYLTLYDSHPPLQECLMLCEVAIYITIIILWKRISDQFGLNVSENC